MCLVFLLVFYALKKTVDYPAIVKKLTASQMGRQLLCSQKGVFVIQFTPIIGI